MAYKIYEKIRFGSFVWTIIDIDTNKNQEVKYLIITDDIVEKQKYDDLGKECTWKNCSLRLYLNKKFLQKNFNAIESKKIIVLKLKSHSEIYNYCSDLTINPPFITKDKIFILSIDEARRYFDNNFEGCWWLRTGDFKSNCSAAVDSGQISLDCFVGWELGIRPACWVSLDENNLNLKR